MSHIIQYLSAIRSYPKVGFDSAIAPILAHTPVRYPLANPIQVEKTQSFFGQLAEDIAHKFYKIDRIETISAAANVKMKTVLVTNGSIKELFKGLRAMLWALNHQVVWRKKATHRAKHNQGTAHILKKCHRVTRRCSIESREVRMTKSNKTKWRVEDYAYRVKKIPNENKFKCIYPDLAGCEAVDKDELAAIKKCKELAVEWLDMGYKIGLPIPEPEGKTIKEREIKIRVPTLVHAQVGIISLCFHESLNDTVNRLMREQLTFFEIKIPCSLKGECAIIDPVADFQEKAIKMLDCPNGSSLLHFDAGSSAAKSGTWQQRVPTKLYLVIWVLSQQSGSKSINAIISMLLTAAIGRYINIIQVAKATAKEPRRRRKRPLPTVATSNKSVASVNG